MIDPVNNKIIVSVNTSQKYFISINGIILSAALKFETNYREKSPTIATVVEGNEQVKKGDILLCHHNLFYLPSPYHIQDDLFAIPYSKVLFAKIDNEGNIRPICGNIICKRIPIKTTLDLPPEYKKTEDKIYQVIDGTGTRYKEGQIILTRPSAGYTIVYNFNGIENRIVKVGSDQVCGFLD